MRYRCRGRGHSGVEVSAVRWFPGVEIPGIVIVPSGKHPGEYRVAGTDPDLSFPPGDYVFWDNSDGPSVPDDVDACHPHLFEMTFEPA